MCQICSMNTLSYNGEGGRLGRQSTGFDPYFAAEMPQYGGGGGNFWASQGATSNQNINGVLSGNKWGGGTLTYSFPTAANQYEAGYSETSTFGEATAALKTATRYAMGLISQYTNLVTQEVAANAAADVRTAFSDSANPTAYAYYPSDSTQGGDIWYGRNYTEYQNPIKGQYAWATVIHELGHAVGLKHGHQTGGPANTAMETAFDQMAYSIMTYRSYASGPTNGYTNETNGYAQTFMMYDIAALQTMYGANFNTNSGNTTYTWSSTTGEMFINGVGQGAPGGNRIFMTIWDGNGTDTYDFSNYTTGLSIDLAPGNFSITNTAATGQRANLGGGNFAAGNIYNALQFNGDARSLIENAYGGRGNDTIAGNAADNTLIGNDGNDTLFGRAGNDTAIGGFGNDTIYGEDGNDTIFGEFGDDTLVGGFGDDVMLGQSDNDTLFGEIGNDTVVGGTGNDVLYGQDGFDTLSGEDGNDRLYGGNNDDRVIAGFGDDVAFGEGGNDTLFGEFGNDTLSGGDGNDAIYGQDGTDTLTGDDGADRLYGGNGDDIIISGFGDDVAFGESDNDTLFGEFGNDTLYGDAGNDSLYGQDGGDFLVGGAGADFLAGGAGNDIFYFDIQNQPADQVQDFNGGEGDRLAFSASAFGMPQGFTLTAGVNFLTGAGVTPTTGNATFYFDTSTRALWFDSNGNGGGGAQVVAFLLNNPTVQATDFMFL